MGTDLDRAVRALAVWWRGKREQDRQKLISAELRDLLGQLSTALQAHDDHLHAITRPRSLRDVLPWIASHPTLATDGSRKPWWGDCGHGRAFVCDGAAVLIVYDYPDAPPDRGSPTRLAFGPEADKRRINRLLNSEPKPYDGIGEPDPSCMMFDVAAEDLLARDDGHIIICGVRFSEQLIDRFAGSAALCTPGPLRLHIRPSAQGTPLRVEGPGWTAIIMPVQEGTKARTERSLCAEVEEDR